MRRFSGFLDRKERNNKDNLRTLGKIFSRAGFVVKNHLDHHQDAYLYIEKPIEHNPIIQTLEFGGIRLYSKGKNIIAYRPQNKENVQPFGTAYLLDVDGMFKDLMKGNQTEEIGADLIKYLVEELLNFFLQSARSQREEDKDIDSDSLGKVIMPGDSVSDYASQASGDLRRNNAN